MLQEHNGLCTWPGKIKPRHTVSAHQALTQPLGTPRHTYLSPVMVIVKPSCSFPWSLRLGTLVFTVKPSFVLVLNCFRGETQTYISRCPDAVTADSCVHSSPAACSPRATGFTCAALTQPGAPVAHPKSTQHSGDPSRKLQGGPTSQDLAHCGSCSGLFLLPTRLAATLPVNSTATPAPVTWKGTLWSYQCSPRDTGPRETQHALSNWGVSFAHTPSFQTTGS